MKKIQSYRDKLLGLATIYKISEIQNYIKNKKKLTTPQIEHILKKNKVPIPTEINKSLLEIQTKKIAKPFNTAGNWITNSKNLILKTISKTIYSLFKGLNFFIYSIYRGIIKFFSIINRGTINILNKAYNFQVEERKVNKFVTIVIFATFSIAILVGGLNIREIIKNDKVVVNKENNLNKTTQGKEKIILKKEKQKAKIKIEKSNDVVNLPAAKKPQSKTELKKKQPLKDKKDTKKNIIKEFVLPDLNLKTETVLTLFDDVKYDLDIVRSKKLVKPIYFTQFPKDLDEIKSVQLKKETFIKIVLPLVVAENQKILDDKNKLNKILLNKKTSEKNKYWLRQKLKEYKVQNGKIKELEKRMDIIPISIAIAQAAKESGWGTSRFALEGNAIFGQWTWNGKGIAPLDRAKEKSHKILRFPILRASVKAYKNNLNTHKSYRLFREKRNELRSKKKSINGLKLIHTLDSYAQTGEKYTKILAQIIEQNSLDEFEGVKLSNSVEAKQLNL